MKIEESAERKRKRGEKRKENTIVVMAFRLRAMKEQGRVTFSHDTTPGGGSPRISLRDLPKRERKYLILIRRQKGRELKK